MNAWLFLFETFDVVCSTSHKIIHLTTGAKLSSHGFNINGDNTTVPNIILRECVFVGLSKNERTEDQQLGKTWANRRLQAYRSPHISKKVLAIAFKWGKHHLRPFPTLWCEDGAGKERTTGRRNTQAHHLLVHHLLNHSFKATQLKSGSFRVTVDGVPKALDVLHKEK